MVRRVKSYLKPKFATIRYVIIFLWFKLGLYVTHIFFPPVRDMACLLFQTPSGSEDRIKMKGGGSLKANSRYNKL